MCGQLAKDILHNIHIVLFNTVGYCLKQHYVRTCVVRDAVHDVVRDI